MDSLVCNILFISDNCYKAKEQMKRRINPLHNTNNPFVKITYPFHPLHGMHLPVISENDKPESCYTCLVQNTYRLKIPKWMTEASSESFSIAEMPIIDPFVILKVGPLINKALQSLSNSNTFDQVNKRKEVEREKQTNGTAVSKTKCVRRHRSASKNPSYKHYRKNDPTTI